MAKSKRSSSDPKPKSDAYVGLLLLSLLAQIAGAVFLYLEYASYPENPPPKVQNSPALVAAQNPNPNPNPPMPNPPMPNPPRNP